MFYASKLINSRCAALSILFNGDIYQLNPEISKFNHI